MLVLARQCAPSSELSGSAALRGAPLVAKPLRRAELLDAVHTALNDAA